MADEHATRQDDTLRGPRCAATFRTASVDEAVAAVEVMYGAHALLLDTRQGLDLRFAGFNVGALSVSAIRYGCAAVGRPARPNEYWMFSYIVSGHAIANGREVGPGMAAIRAPGTTTDIEMSADLQLVNLKVENDDLLAAQAILGGRLPRERLHFPACVRAGDAGARGLADLLLRLQALPAPSPSLLGAPLERRWQEAALLELLLAMSPMSDSCPAESGASRAAVERAVELMDSDPAADLHLGDLARAAGVSVRSLTRRFERTLGLSPMRYLQQQRLDRVRNDLLDGHCSVTQAACRWGFANLGDFAVRYRMRFGERPSETLRRKRSSAR